MAESVDVVIVGSRCAGSAAAIAFAQRGRRVLALDSASFPSDTLSTHLFFPHHWAEIERLGALPRVLALKAPMHTRAGLGTARTELAGPYSSYEGFAAGSCVRRPGLDAALVETAREAGAEVRERTKVVELLRDGSGRVNGVRWERRDGASGTVEAKLTIGADGRRSSVARLVETQAHHEQPNGRLLAYAYYADPHEDLRNLAMQWRQARDLVTVFPCDGDQSLVLLMPPVDRADAFRVRGVETFEAIVANVAPLRERLGGCERLTRPRVSYDHPSYFRHSHGPGWALAGDAGHFKDPVTAQGIRDALRFGRLLGEVAAPVLEDPAALDAALAEWEIDRDRQCLPMYQWANGLGLPDAVSPIEAAAYQWFADRPGGATEVLDVFSRRRRPDRVFNPVRFARWATLAARAPGADKASVRRTVARDLGRETARLREAAGFKRRRAASAAAAFGPRVALGGRRDDAPNTRASEES